MIRVGGATEIEVKEKKGRVEDALIATRAAVEEGIVLGGGVALLCAKKAVGKISNDNSDVQAGINIVLKALEAPLPAEPRSEPSSSPCRSSASEERRPRFPTSRRLARDGPSGLLLEVISV